jgi:hypothetical protein
VVEAALLQEFRAGTSFGNATAHQHSNVVDPGFGRNADVVRD